MRNRELRLTLRHSRVWACSLRVRFAHFTVLEKTWREADSVCEECLFSWHFSFVTVTSDLLFSRLFVSTSIKADVRAFFDQMMSHVVALPVSLMHRRDLVKRALDPSIFIAQTPESWSASLMGPSVQDSKTRLERRARTSFGRHRQTFERFSSWTETLFPL